MKKCLITKLFLCFLVCLTVSCSQDSSFESQSITAKSQLKMTQVLGEKNQENQKIEYNLLSSEEKYSMWVNKYESLIDDGTLFKSNITLNDEQKELIEELKNKLTQNVFDEKDNDEKAYFNNIYTPSFLKRAQKIFTYDQIGLIFYKLSEPTTDITLKQLSVSARANSECNCNLGAIFSCQWGGDKCGSSSCSGASSGCGFSWIWECNGSCRAV